MFSPEIYAAGLINQQENVTLPFMVTATDYDEGTRGRRVDLTTFVVMEGGRGGDTFLLMRANVSQ